MHRELLEKTLSQYKKIGERYNIIFNKDIHSYHMLYFYEGKWYSCLQQNFQVNEMKKSVEKPKNQSNYDFRKSINELPQENH